VEAPVRDPTVEVSESLVDESQYRFAFGAKMSDRKPGPPSATWRDIKQLGGALLLVVPFIAIVSYGAVGLVGKRAAFWIGVGLAALTVITFSLIVSVNLLASFGHDLLKWVRRRKRRR